MNLSPTSWRNILLGAVFALLIVGAVATYSACGVKADLQYDDDTVFLRKHLNELVLGLVLMVALAIIPPEMLRKGAGVMLAAAFLMLIVVLVPGLGREYNGSRRWFSIAGRSFQPSEFAKIALLIFIAAWVAKKKRRELKRFRTAAAVPIGLIICAAILIEREPDKSTALFIVTTGTLLLLIGGIRFRHIAASYGVLLLICLLAIGAAVLAGKGDSVRRHYSYAADRIDAYVLQLRGDEDRKEIAGEYQIKQSRISLAGGGATGVGPGRGLQQLGFLPEADSDFIFAVIGQELGFIGSLGVIVLFALVVLSGISIAFKTADRFSALLCLGLSGGIGIQAVIHIAVISGFAPTTGIALPFISRGGSAMMMSLVSVGMILSIARISIQKSQAKRRKVIARSVRPRRRAVAARDFAR